MQNTILILVVITVAGIYYIVRLVIGIAFDVLGAVLNIIC